MSEAAAAAPVEEPGWGSTRKEKPDYDGPAGMQPEGVIDSKCDEICDDIDLTDELLRGIYVYGFEKPLAIQQRAIVKRKDVIAQAQSITVLQTIDTSLRETQVLILAPTRELEQQIQKCVIILGDYMGARCHAYIGGTSVREDMSKLDGDQHVVVGTPGRVFDMICRKALRTRDIERFMLFEADKMLSRGFKVTPRLVREPCRIPLTITDVQKILDEKEKKGDRGEKRTIKGEA